MVDSKTGFGSTGVRMAGTTAGDDPATLTLPICFAAPGHARDRGPPLETGVVAVTLVPAFEFQGRPEWSFFKLLPVVAEGDPCWSVQEQSQLCGLGLYSRPGLLPFPEGVF